MKSSAFIFLITCIVLTNEINGQDIFDLSHSRQYADYLFRSKSFEKAATEYERVCFLDSQDWESHFKLMQSYRKNERPELAISHYTKIIIRLPTIEFQKFELEKNISVFKVAPYSFIYSKNNDSTKSMIFFRTPALLLSHNWAMTQKSLSSMDYRDDKYLTRYYDNALSGLRLNYKKPWLAGAMSLLVPGLGKVYTGYYKDGVFAFVITGLTGYQAYRGCHLKGVKSGIFILYSALTAGFYIGNIYGSIKSARQKNKRLNEKLDIKTRTIFSEWSE